MFAELHIIQHFAPGNLNRDDTGAPKDCEFGGYRRARISSQCIKRAIRREFRNLAANGRLSPSDLALRTKRIAGELRDRLMRAGKDEASATAAARALLDSLKLAADAKNPEKTEYLLFLGLREIERLAAVILEYWDALQGVVKAGAGKSGDGGKKEASQAVPAEVRNAALAALDGGKAVDLALFGRMLADLPERNVDAACQVAHAISTNRVTMEIDYFTAVDDLLPEDTMGADMIGTVEFNSACYYRYANVHIEGLVRNLQDDRDLAATALEAFLRAAIRAIPTGKQNTFAAHNPPSLVFGVVRRDASCNLANAFVSPARPGEECDLVQDSIRKLDAYWARLTAMYGVDGIVGGWVVTSEPDFVSALAAEPSQSVPTVDALVQGMLSASGLNGGGR